VQQTCYSILSEVHLAKMFSDREKSVVQITWAGAGPATTKPQAH